MKSMFILAGFQVGIYLKCNGVYVVNTETICTYDGQNIVPAKGKIIKVII